MIIAESLMFSKSRWAITLGGFSCVALALLGPVQSDAAASRQSGVERVVHANAPTSTSVDKRVIVGEGEPSPLTKAEKSDLRFYAEKSSIPFDELVQRQLGLREFQAAADHIAAAVPESFVQAGVNLDKSDSKFYLQLVDPPDDKILSVLSTVPATIDVQSGLPLSARAAESAMGEVLTTLSAAPEVNVPAAALAELNGAGDAIRVELRRAPGASTAAVDDLVANALRVVRRHSGRVGISFIEDPGLPAATSYATVKGGHTLNNSIPQCTSGFTGRRNNVLGVVTAAHCPENLQYDFQSVITYVTSSSPEPGGITDLQFHRTNAGNQTVNKFQSDSCCERTVAGIANPAVNSTICLHGIATAYDCDIVTNANTCHNFGQPTCGLFKVGVDIGGPGDSGGPMFFGSTAEGFVTGGDGTALWGTRIGIAGNNLGVTILQ